MYHPHDSNKNKKAIIDSIFFHSLTYIYEVLSAEDMKLIFPGDKVAVIALVL